MDNKNVILHVTALQCMVGAILLHISERDPESLRDILDNPLIRSPETAPDLDHFSQKDRLRLKEHLRNLLGPIDLHTAPPASRA